MLKHKVFPYQADKVTAGVGGTETTENQIVIQGRKCRICKLWSIYSEKKNKKQQRINGTKNILMKSCTTEGDRDYDQKSSGRVDSDTVWNYLCSGRFLACHISSRLLQKFKVSEREEIHVCYQAIWGFLVVISTTFYNQFYNLSIKCFLFRQSVAVSNRFLCFFVP